MERDFLKKKKELYNTIFKSSEESKKKLMYPFSLFAANIKRFLGNSYTPFELEEAYKNVLLNQRLAGLEQHYRENLLNSKIINKSGIDFNLIASKNQPIIFTTFHLGSYRLLNSYLYEKGLKNVLIVRGKVFEEQLESIFNEVKPTLKKKEESDIIILDANDRRSIFRIKNLISKGYCLTVYLDGNTGVNDEKGVFTKNHLEIPFLNSKINIKKGIGQLAYLLGADLVPVFSYRDVNQTNNIEFLERVKATDYVGKEFIEESLQICYKHLENYLLQYPWQWECWTYIHNWIDRNDINVSADDNENVLNMNRFLPFYLKNDEYLMNLKTYKILHLKKDGINALKNGNLSMFSLTEIKELKSKLILN
jgi:KDO2-lipid IV(A) lauroyltransferase